MGAQAALEAMSGGKRPRPSSCVAQHLIYALLYGSQMRADPMRAKIILTTVLSGLLLAATQPSNAQAPTQLAAATAPKPTQPETSPANGSFSATHILWYTDPIFLALAAVAVFAAIDISILIAKNSHAGHRHAMR